MSKTYFFYDLETSGLSAQNDRIMQFAGQRTDMDLNPIGEPYNVLVRLNEDTLPSPDALLVTGISPQQTVSDGYTEAEFAHLLMDEVFTPETITVGFNSIRFDDEFIRHLFWRNFIDPYEWAYKDGRSRWDLLDVTRMTRALRPEGIEWPFIDGKAVNKLELITKLNGIDHFKAHDALSDVEALIAVTKLIRDKQPQLFEYLLKMRDKNEVKKLVNLENRQPFVYVSGRYDAEFNKATVAYPLAPGKNGNVIVYDLRHDPSHCLQKSAEELKKIIYAKWDERQANNFLPVSVKELQYNRAPAVAPLGVLEQTDGWEKVSLDIETIEKHKALLLQNPHFAENIRSIFEEKREFAKSPEPEAQLYDGFVNDRDRLRIETVRNATERELADFHPEFTDERLPSLLLHYKARNYPKTLTETESEEWEAWRAARIQAQLPGFMGAYQRMVKADPENKHEFLRQELQLWLESVMPVENDF